MIGRFFCRRGWHAWYEWGLTACPNGRICGRCGAVEHYAEPPL